MNYRISWRIGVSAVLGAAGLLVASARVPSSAATLAYLGTPVGIPGRIEAANFDNGGDGVSYYDTTPGNAGGKYRSTNVDIETSMEGGYNVGYIDKGEWLNYTINVATAGSYIVQLRVASPVGASMHIGFNTASNVWNTVTIPVTGDWQKWTTVSLPVTLGAGTQQMTLLADTSYYNISYIVVSAASVVTAPPPPPPTTPPPPTSPGGRIVLEDFSSLRQNHDSPPAPLWQPYTTGSSTGHNQTGSVINGMYHLLTGSGDQPYWMFFPYPYNVMTGFAKGNLRSGTWNANVNRLTFWMRTSARIARKPGGDQTVEIGTYTKQSDGQASNQGDHYYHYLCADWWPNRWMLVTLNRQVQHKVGQDAGINWPENPTAPGWNYFDGLTRFYFTSEYGDPSLWGNQSFDFTGFEFSTVTGEPDTQVASVTAIYTGNHYEVSWQGPKNQNVGYTVRYATTSMHAGAAGTAGGTVNNPGNTYQGTFWSSAAMSQPAGGMYFAIQPLGSTKFTEIYLPAK